MGARSKARKRALDVLYAADLRGHSATVRTKPATVETGHEIQVPLFINQGEKVKVDTRDSSYLGRVKA